MEVLEIVVRGILQTDAIDAARLLSDLGYHSEVGQVEERIRSCSQPPDSIVLVAERLGAVAGLVSFHRIPLFHEVGYLGRITSLVIAPGFRGCGIGRQLVAAVEEHGWRHNCLRIEVTSGDHRPDAHAFYEHIGYRSDCRRFIKVRPVNRL